MGDTNLSTIPVGPTVPWDVIGSDRPMRKRPTIRSLNNLRPRVSYVDADRDIRPTHLVDMIGQEAIKSTLRTFMDAAIRRDEPLDHTFISGPPGLGKTTIATVIATELDCNVTYLTGANVTYDDIFGWVADAINDTDPENEEPYRHRVLFIDEIHAVSRQAQVLLLPLLEEYRFRDRVLAPFTVIGATTDPAKISRPLRNRFGIDFQLDYYTDEEIALIVKRTLGVLCGLDADYIDTHMTTDSQQHMALLGLASRARGVPRNANRLLRRTLDFIVPATEEQDEDDDDEAFGEDGEAKFAGFTPDIVTTAMKALGISRDGLTTLDRKVLRTMMMRFHGRPVGLKALASTLGETADNLEFDIEPPLVRMGYIDREPAGRTLTERGMVAAAHIIKGTIPW